MHLYVFSCFFLFATALICLIGLISPRFDDNLFQNIGMGLLAIGCGSRIPDVWGNLELPLDWFMIHVGMGMFAIGVFFKVFMRERQQRFLDFVQSVWRAPHAHSHAVATAPRPNDGRE